MRFMLVFLVFIAWVELFAQLPDYELHLGRDQGVVRAPSGMKVLYSDDKVLCVAKWRTMNSIERPWMLTWYDQRGLYKLDSLVFDIREGGKKCKMDQLVTINEKIFLIYSTIGEHPRKISVFARQIDPQRRHLSDESRKVFEFTATGHHPIRAGRMGFAVSQDQSKISFIRSFSRDSRDREIVFFAVLDSGLNEQWKQVVTLPYPYGLVKVVNLKLSNDGDAFALTMFKTFAQNNPTLDVVITRDSGKSARRYPVQVKTGFVSSAQIELANGKLVCAGFYSKTGGPGASGIFLNSIDIQTLVHSEATSDFDPKLVLQGVNARDFAAIQKKADLDNAAELNRFFIDHIIPEPDGGFILLGEQRYDYSVGSIYSTNRIPVQTRSSYRQNRNLYQPSRFYRGDIIALKIDATGNILWENKIHKSQDTNNYRSIFSSYLVLNIKGRLNLLFNEDRRNIGGFAVHKEKDFGGFQPVVAVVALDEKGQAIRELIYDSVEWPLVTSPAMSMQLSDKEVLLYGQKFRREQFSRIRFK
ncbi:MAG TPA: hypothetical protein VG737_07795 [Cyclobacteriaceae bacterium]|nr:hypothetical protein [Cyclobacteriaceae bacterium]